MFTQKKTNCNCCTAAYLFTYCCLLLPIICVALCDGHFLSLWSVVFRATKANPQPALFRAINIWRNATLPSVTCKSFAFFSRMAPVINLSVKFDANIFIGDRYMAIFTTSPIWLWSAYTRPFWGGFLGIWPVNVVGYCRDPQKTHPWPETRVMAYTPCSEKSGIFCFWT